MQPSLPLALPGPAESQPAATSSAGNGAWLSFVHPDRRGVIADRPFARGEVIERAPVVPLSEGDWAHLEHTIVPGSCCSWGSGRALVLGLVPWYNRSDAANATLAMHLEALAVGVVALRDIGPGEEVLLDGGGSFWLPTDERALAEAREVESGYRARQARDSACRELERQALAQAERRALLAATMPLTLLPALSLPLAEGVLLELVLVPAGPFVLGAEEQDPDVFTNDAPAHTRYLDDYYIGRYPVTVRQFAAFAAASGYRTLAEMEGNGWVYSGAQWSKTPGANWRHPRGPQSVALDKGDHPVTLVTWDDAVAFCRWASAVTGRRVALPSELEWEKAARGPDGCRWPWGQEAPDATRCNYSNNMGDTTPVGHYSPRGDSPYRCADMAGNVLEWTDSPLRAYPYEDDEGRQSPTVRVVRSGGFHHGRLWMRCAGRYWDSCQERRNNCGFRVKVAVEVSEDDPR
jgi:formylglycine-generating enzyme required for sulfatase activity